MLSKGTKVLIKYPDQPGFNAVVLGMHPIVDEMFYVVETELGRVFEAKEEYVSTSV